jgi:hypothetical protein
MMLLEVSLSCLHFSLMVSEGEVKSPFFASVVSLVWTYVIKVDIIYVIYLIRPLTTSNDLISVF